MLEQCPLFARKNMKENQIKKEKTYSGILNKKWKLTNYAILK
jgi:hypothetical protein